ncbi:MULTISPECIES: DMT family transporter [Kitasatospora]|uniref:DMT family transporter n=1 Tax=Kitasatospora cystarginea TaxID=58350 RepID=A0ABN3ENS1_9ACTN
MTLRESAGPAAPAKGAARPRALGALCAGLGTALVGTSFVATSLLTHYPFLSGQTVRFALGGLCLLLLAALARTPLPRPTRREWGLLALLAGTGLVGFNLACLRALRSAEPAVLGVVVGATPLLVAIAGPLLGGRRVSWRLTGSSALVVAGAALVLGYGRGDLTGFAFSLLALLGEVSFTLLAVPLLPRLGAIPVATYVCGLATLEMGALAAAVELPGGQMRWPHPGELAALGYLAAAVTAGAFILYYVGLSRLGPEATSLFAGLIPVAAAFAAPVVGSGTLGAAQLAGSALVGVGLSAGLSAPAPTGAAVGEAASKVPVPTADDGS